MATPEEGGTPQNPVPEVPPNGSGEGQGDEMVSIPKKELDAIKHRADVSSQNFERLQKSNEKIAELQTEIATLKENPVPSELDTERLRKLEGDLADIKAKETRREVLTTYPQLQEVQAEFDSYLADPDNKGMNIKTAAKAFLTEKGLLDPTPRRGLERPTGGDRTPTPQGMSVTDAENLRKNDPKRYRELLKKGQLKVDYAS